MRYVPSSRTNTTYHRAVHRASDGRLFVNPFDRTGSCRGWYYATQTSLPEGIALASLEITTDPVTDDREVLVRFVLGSDSPAARERLVRWARGVGHHRLWFPDDYVELDRLPAPAASVGRCDVCAATFREDGVSFHNDVRRTGTYPLTCPICGAPMAVWDVEFLGEDDDDGEAPIIRGYDA